ncbi:MAG: hypothetical protein NWE98_04770 [Candidatus Bathyarchaeota archaeon]|nr:hypothetical protein [Candidatus Bathyarchaeota archaeon]
MPTHPHPDAANIERCTACGKNSFVTPQQNSKINATTKSSCHHKTFCGNPKTATTTQSLRCKHPST